MGDSEPTPSLKGVLLAQPWRQRDAIHEDLFYLPTIQGRKDENCDGVTITHADAIWILGTFRTSIIVND